MFRFKASCWCPTTQLALLCWWHCSRPACRKITSSLGKKREVWRMRSPCWKSCGKGPPESTAVWTVRFAIPGRNKIFFFPAKRWGARSASGREVKQRPASSVEVKNERSCISPPFCLHSVGRDNYPGDVFTDAAKLVQWSLLAGDGQMIFSVAAIGLRSTQRLLQCVLGVYLSGVAEVSATYP